MPYQPYRGPRRARRGKVTLIVAFILLALVAATVIFFAAQEYVVFTAEGFRFDFPLFQRQTEPATEPAAADETVTVEIIDTTAPSTEPPTTAPATEPKYYKEFTEARLTAPAVFMAGSKGQAVYIKAADGIWNISGQNPTAEQEQMLSGLRQSGSVAVFSAMRDAVGPRNERSLAITTSSGATWLDYEYISWYNPYKGVGGLLDAVRLCAENGVGELILTNLQFPTRGRLEYITYGSDDSPENRSAAIEAALAPAREYLDESGSQMYLSAVLTDAAAEQFFDGDAGQNARGLALLCDIVYVQTTDPDYDLNPLIDALQGTGCRVGLWLDSASAPERRIDYVLLK